MTWFELFVLFTLIFDFDFIYIIVLAEVLSFYYKLSRDFSSWQYDNFIK